MDFKADINGADYIDRVFRNLPRAMQRKAYYQSLYEGAVIVRDKASENVKSIVSSEATGTLSRNLVVNRLKITRGFHRVAVRVRKKTVNKIKRDKDGNPVRVGLYGSVLEYGKNRQAPRSWLRKAIRSKQFQAINTITIEMNKRMLMAMNEAKVLAGIGGRRYKI